MIIYKENLAMALDTILSHKFRSFLTVLGIIIGIVTVVLIGSILTGLKRDILSQVEEFGTNNIYAFHMSTMSVGRRSEEEWKRKPLTSADAQAIKELCPSVADVSWQGASFRSRVQVSYRGNTLREANFLGVPANYGTVGNVKLENGRFFTQAEDFHRMQVVVIGPDAAEAMFPDMDPIGKQILINEHLFTVIGVTEKSKSSLLGGQNDNSIIIPYRTYCKLSPSEEMLVLFIQAKSGFRDKAKDEVESLLRQRRRLKPSQDNDFDLTTSERIGEQLDSIMMALSIGAIAISSVGLLVGGIGVMNIMLVSVTERTRQIGVRKAIGARKRDIVLQFLFEAMTLSGVGGMLGILFALGISSLVIALFPAIPTYIPLWSIIAGLSVSIGIGLVFGVWPARKAAMLDPIEALRYE